MPLNTHSHSHAGRNRHRQTHIITLTGDTHATITARMRAGKSSNLGPLPGCLTVCLETQVPSRSPHCSRTCTLTRLRTCVTPFYERWSRQRSLANERGISCWLSQRLAFSAGNLPTGDQLFVFSVWVSAVEVCTNCQICSCGRFFEVFLSSLRLRCLGSSRQMKLVGSITLLELGFVNL